MALSRKHYNEIAQIIKLERNKTEVDSEQFNSLVNELSDFFQRDNANFNPERFIQATYDRSK